MLEAVREIGNSVESHTIEDYLRGSKLRKTKVVLSILIEGNSYKRITIEEKKDGYASRYLYSPGRSPRSPDMTPTSIITTAEKTFHKKILAWFKRYRSYDSTLERIGNILVNNANNIVKTLERTIKNLPEEQITNVLLTVKIKKAGRETFLGQCKIVRKILKSQFNPKNVNAQIGNCLFCSKLKKLIAERRSPISDVFSFSTFDKKGFLYARNEANSYKQIPVCFDCYIDLKKGKEWIDNYAYFDLEGYKYYIIPDFWKSLSRNKKGNQLLKNFKQSAEYFAKRQRNIDKTTLNYETNLMSEEEDLLEYLAGKRKKINFSLNFLFLSLMKGGRYITIRKYIEDVPLTWIKKIFDAFNAVLRMKVFAEESMRELVHQNYKGNLNVEKGTHLAALVREFYPINSLDVNFLDMISKLLNGFQIASPDLFRAFLRSIRKRIHKNWVKTKMVMLKSYALFLTMHGLNLISDMKRQVRELSNEKNDNKESDSFNDVLDILDSHSKKAVFLEGILVGKILNIQYAKRGGTPFLDTLHGLHISFSEAKRLLPKIVNKLYEYGVFYTRRIEQDAAHQFVLSEKPESQITDDETSYYLTLGMLLHQITRVKEQQSDNS